MRNLNDLYEMSRKKNKLIKEYSSEHDYEIGEQRYYKFLVNDFYNFICRKWNLYGRGKIGKEYIDSLNGETLTISRDLLRDFFIQDFMTFYHLGNTSVGEKTVTICFDRVSLNEVMASFYTELQRLEYYMKSKEEMKQDLDNFKENNKDFTKRQKEKNNAKEMLEERYDNEYFSFLVSIWNEAYSYLESLGWRDELPPLKHFSWEYKTEEGFESIKRFIEFYGLGICYIQYNEIKIDFEVNANEIRKAYFMEMQRLEHFKYENGVNVKKLK